MAREILNPKYQMGWSTFFSKVKQTVNTVEQVVENVEPERVEELKPEQETQPIEDVETPDELLFEDELGDADLFEEDTTDLQGDDIEIEEETSDDEQLSDDEIKKEELKDLQQVIVNNDVKTFREAQEYMKSNFNLTHKDVVSREKLLEKMSEFYVEFPNLEL